MFCLQWFLLHRSLFPSPFRYLLLMGLTSSRAQSVCSTFLFPPPSSYPFPVTVHFLFSSVLSISEYCHLSLDKMGTTSRATDRWVDELGNHVYL
ncbi:hypothetical protein B0H66DRAFT_267141 [Apodospora peruviana]|uniref:Secreted protein n=1 Tax=Apodospora peruviana TaxID=516989 RepID=A0AAE0M5E4_9PEZI|nr:hypothetical protein B0H66DRAFT_267141 [Apodospora peruviana]